MRRVWIILFMAGMSLATGALANNFYIGSWTYSGCTLHLKGPNALGQYAAETNFCSGDWAFVSGWRPTAKGVELYTILNKSVATLSLSQGNLTVRLADGSRIAFKRTTPILQGSEAPLASSGAPVGKTEPFVAGIGCVKRGAGDACASKQDLGLPKGLPRNSTTYTKAANVSVFSGLNFRAKIGFDQPVHFVIPAGTCVPIWACFDDDDTGPWCVTRLNGKQGYIAKFSERQNGEVQVNYGNGCSG
jgi:hypothetical protein